MSSKIIPFPAIAARCDEWRARGQKIVFTNGCFDILHAGHVDLLRHAKSLGDVLVVGLNADASVKRLKGQSRPIHDQDARALVMSALEMVDAVCIFEQNTPVELIAQVRPNIHVKGGDYRPEDLPEGAEVQKHGGQIVIVPLRQGFSTSAALRAMNHEPALQAATVVIPARLGSTRLPGKMLADLGGQPVIARTARAALRANVAHPVLVATDDERIAGAVANIEGVKAVMTGECRTGTDRIAQAVAARGLDDDAIIVNVQGDEPFVDPAHLDALIAAMQDGVQMATLATPLDEPSPVQNPNIVKVVLDKDGHALYFSRLPIPFDRDGQGTRHLRHLGVYAYRAKWLREMAQLAPTPLEEAEKLEQLRALENGARIKVVIVENVVDIAIDTPDDLARAEAFLSTAKDAEEREGREERAA